MYKCGFLMLTLCIILMMSLSAYAENVIIAYDFSGSMCKLRDSKSHFGVKVFMKEEDLARLNNYLTQLIYVGQLSRILANDAEIVTKLGSKPLYNQSDKMWLFKFHTVNEDLINGKTDVSQSDFEKALPDPWRQYPFSGQDSFISKAELHAHELADTYYGAEVSSKKATYIIIISDYDEDISLTGDKDVLGLKKLSELMDKQRTQKVYDLLVNRHVYIRVYVIAPEGVSIPSPGQVTETTISEAPFTKFVILSSKNSNTPVKQADLMKRDKWRESGPLFISSQESLPASFKPQELDMYIGENKRPYPLKSDKALPQGFQVKLPDDKDLKKALITNPPKFLLKYSYDGNNHIVPIKQNIRFNMQSTGKSAGKIIAIILAILFGLAMLGFLVWYLIKNIGGKKTISFLIATTDSTFKKEKEFTLSGKETLSLGSDRANYDYVFDVGSSGSFLKNTKGKLDLNTYKGRTKISLNDEFKVADDKGDDIKLTIRPLKTTTASDNFIGSKTKTDNSSDKQTSGSGRLDQI